MFRVSSRLGAVVASADEQQMAALDEFGEKLGLAFQIVDDLLDIRSNEQALGKSVGKDAEQGKMTFPAMLGEDESRRRAVRLIREAEQALAMFATRAKLLESLARYVLERSR
jgi:geranylgeranyl pyrophosphate synthase